MYLLQSYNNWTPRSAVASDKTIASHSQDKVKPAKKKPITSLSEYFGSAPVKQEVNLVKPKFSKTQKVLVVMVIG